MANAAKTSAENIETQADRDELIRRRAYSIWEKEGRPDGKQDDHWRQANAEMHGLEDAPAHHRKDAPHTAPAGAKDKASKDQGS